MSAYLIRRIIQMVLVLLVSSMAIYGLLLAVPGGPLAELRHQAADKKSSFSAEQIARMEKMLGLHLPKHLQYVAWLAGDDWMGRIDPEYAGDRKGVLRGDFGDSFKQHRPVLVMIRERLFNTVRLMGASAIISLMIAIPVGIYSAVRQYSKLDYAFTFATFFGIAIPGFWFGLMLILLFANQFQKWGLPFFPGSGTISTRIRPGSIEAFLGITRGSWGDVLTHMFLPVLSLSLRSMAGWARFVRSSMLEVLRQDYVRTARAKGLTERVIIAKHALRNALIPLVTIITFEIPALFGGAILTESVFGYPGMGRLYLDALGGKDFPVVQGFLMISALLVVIATLLSDVLYTVVDPRIRFS
ncbi:MAG: ABC transporter permease [Anaerolineae bacterium]|nr:ABC transporter permease [Ardenticatenia bacterium]MBK8541568.1 ABC transporter permease [Ardenticatenia bacterium]HQZ70588.1 ABC transporter permease [Anaerolineae bacterium]HRA21071.1 ABC transporter permease [Anaerolineae bacterium]